MLPPAGVLIAVAEEFSRRNIIGMLPRETVGEIKSCTSSEQVAATLNQSGGKKWRLLILETRLPGAMDTLRELRLQYGNTLKVILVISSPAKSEILEAIQGGTDDIITFPFSQATLEVKVQRLLGGRPAPVARAVRV